MYVYIFIIIIFFKNDTTVLVRKYLRHDYSSIRGLHSASLGTYQTYEWHIYILYVCARAVRRRRVLPRYSTRTRLRGVVGNFKNINRIAKFARNICPPANDRHAAVNCVNNVFMYPIFWMLFRLENVARALPSTVNRKHFRIARVNPVVAFLPKRFPATATHTRAGQDNPK